MYLIPKDLEVNYAFPEINFMGWTLQVFISDLATLIGIPLMATFGLSNDVINLVPNIPIFLGISCVVIALFCVYLTIFPSPVPLTRNYKRFVIWMNRPKGTYLAPPSQDIMNLTFKEQEEDLSCEIAPKSLKWYHKLHHKFLKPKQGMLSKSLK